MLSLHWANNPNSASDPIWTDDLRITSALLLPAELQKQNKMVQGEGLEPSTAGSKVLRSANWTIPEWHRPQQQRLAMVKLSAATLCGSYHFWFGDEATILAHPASETGVLPNELSPNTGVWHPVDVLLHRASWQCWSVVSHLRDVGSTVELKKQFHSIGVKPISFWLCGHATRISLHLSRARTPRGDVVGREGFEPSSHRLKV